MRKFVHIAIDNNNCVAVADDGTVWRTTWEWDEVTRRLSWECIGTTPQQEVKPWASR